MRLFENRVMRIFSSKRDEVIGGGRKLQKAELHNLYSLPRTVIKWRRMRWAGHVSCMGEKRNPYGIFVGRPEGKRPL
jgi:hypothetical protein